MTNQQAFNRLAGDVSELYGNMMDKHPDMAKREKAESEEALERIRKALDLEEWL